MVSMDDRLAVFDFGSARTKLLVVYGDTRAHGEQLRFRFKEETGDAMRLDAKADVSESGVETVLAVTKRLLAVAVQHKCTRVIAVATDVFRRARNGGDVLYRLAPMVGPVFMLNATVEGQVFYSAVSVALHPHSSFAVADVGGGSVQVAWGEETGSTVSLRTGTFFLERMFHDGRMPTDSEYRLMYAYIDEAVRAGIPASVRCDAVVLGSNCMGDFVRSALAASAQSPVVAPREDGGVPVTVLEALCEEISGRPYRELGCYYPDNPGFMAGADKALMNALAVARRVGAQVIIPTNESVSSGLAHLGLQRPDILQHYGLKATPLKA